MKTDTIRTVIEIVPDWKIYEGKYAQLSDEMAETPEGYRFFLTDQILLDYLAAAAVRVVDAKYDTERLYVDSDRWMVRIERHSIGTMAHCEGPNRTENTLEAIAEFVRSGGFESE